MSVEPVLGEPDAGDVVWFERLFAATYDDLLRYAARRVGLSAAPDVVAQVFLTAWRRRDGYDRDGARLWLFGAARLIVANADRSVQRTQRLAARMAQDGTVDEPDPADAVVTRLRVREVLAELPPAEAEALRLVAWDGFDLAEAAVIAGCSRATFRVRLSRARRRATTLLSADARRAERTVRSDAPPAAEGRARP